MGTLASSSTINGEGENFETSYLLPWINRFYDGVEAKTRKSQASFQII